MSYTPGAELERIRTAELKAYNILDTLRENDYEDITYLASAICQVPIALISFVDKDRQWFKSHRGVAITETSREYSFCAHVLHNPSEPLIVTDLRADDRFKNNPMVTGESNIVFYAGFPLVNEAGYCLGTVCVIDREPRKLTGEQEIALKMLATQVMNLLELRKANQELRLLKRQLETRNKDLEQFAMVVAHDIKSPLSTVLSANQLLAGMYDDCTDEDAIRLISASSGSANKIKSLVDGILSYYKGDSDNKSYETINLLSFFDGLKQTVSSPKSYELNYVLKNDAILFNKTQLEQIFFNLINNSIRYNTNDVAKITITSGETINAYHFTLTDNGIGIAAENLNKIFDLYTTISARDSFGLKNSGIGLPTVKKIIENAGGDIQVYSKLGEGTTFTFTLIKQNAE